jgi:hypothetical protein
VSQRLGRPFGGVRSVRLLACPGREERREIDGYACADGCGDDTASVHITVTREALQQLPSHRPGTRPGCKGLIRVDGAGATHEFVDRIAGQRLSYSIGYTRPANTAELLTRIPEDVWTPGLGRARADPWRRLGGRAESRLTDGCVASGMQEQVGRGGYPKVLA